MSTPTYTPLATTTLSASAASVTFSSINQSYGDLVLVATGGQSFAGTISIEIEPNGDATNGSVVLMQGDGSTTDSSTVSRLIFEFDDTNSLAIVQIMDYSATDKHKSFLIRDNKPASVRAYAGRWADTSAITSLVLNDQSGQTLDAGCTFSLYGIAK